MQYAVAEHCNNPSATLHTPSSSLGTSKLNGSGDTQVNVGRNLKMTKDFSTPNSQGCNSLSHEQPITMEQLIDEVFEDDHKFFIMMQDEGEPLSASKRCKIGYWKCKRDDKQYKELKIAGEDLICRLRDDSLYNSKKRNHLCRCFVFGEHGTLGRRNRVPIPEYVVAFIRSIFPDPDCSKLRTQYSTRRLDFVATGTWLDGIKGKLNAASK